MGRIVHPLRTVCIQTPMLRRILTWCPSVIYDACVLYPFHLRDLLIRVGQAGLVHARWTNAILDECFTSITANRPELREPLLRTRQLMNASIRDVLVEDYEELISGLTLPDPDDRPILAAAIKAGAQVIVTFNLKDFPASILDRYGMEAQHPDAFVTNLLDLDARAVAVVIEAMNLDLQSTPGIPFVLNALDRTGLHSTAQELRSFLQTE